MVVENGISIRLSEKSNKLLRTLAKTKKLPENINKYVKQHKNRRQLEGNDKPYLSVQDIKHLREALSSEEDVHVHELLEDSTIEFYKKPEPPRNLELQARIEKLKQEQEEKEYYQMVKNVDLQRAKTFHTSNFSADVKAMRAQMVAVVNFIVSVGGTFAFCYKATEYALHSVPAQVLVGISASTVVALAELYFLAKQLDYHE